jgi:hypothetical protein
MVAGEQKGTRAMNDRVMNTQELEATECHCGTVPLSHLGLDIDEPVSGWLALFAERGISVDADDIGRPSVPRRVLGELLAEREEQEARIAARRAEQEAALEAPVLAGVPALEGASPFESLVAAGGVVTPEQEFGQRPKPNFIAEEIAAGQRHMAEQRAQQEAVEKARKVLEGRDHK